MNENINIIPEDSKIHDFLVDIIKTSDLIILSGLPGVGKSLYIHEIIRIAGDQGRKLNLIQWDVARKAFETPFILTHFPMGAGTVHNGLKLIAGEWLMEILKDWNSNKSSEEILLIEAPLVGHRFVELVHKQQNDHLEALLSSEKTKVVVPIPTKEVRQKIEENRKKQVDEDAKVWSGAKPSVMYMLWKMICEIANEFGMDINLDGIPPYSPGIYEYVYSIILKHRNFEPLIVNEVFKVPDTDESFFHSHESIVCSSEDANQYAEKILKMYEEEEIDTITNRWYLT